MAKGKRPQIIGKVADVSFTEPTLTPQEGGDATAPEQPAPTAYAVEKSGRGKAAKRVMVTFYLPPELVDKLDRAWIQRRLKDRKFQKSFLVAEALEAYLKG
jgi:hypothetical protein